MSALLECTAKATGTHHRPGHGDKIGTFLVKENICLRLTLFAVGSILCLVGFVFGLHKYSGSLESNIVLMEKERQHVVHTNAIQLLSLGAELESHLANELQWDEQESQFVERGEELEEKLRVTVGNALYEEFKNMSEAILKAAGENPERLAIEKVISEWHSTITKQVDSEIDSYMNEMQSLNQKYMEKTKEETKRSRTRMSSIKYALKDFAKLAKETSGIENFQIDDDLDMKVEHFFEEAETFVDRHAGETFIPFAVENELVLLRDDFERQNPESVLDRIQELLFPGGMNEGNSKYGLKPFSGGSVEAYLDEVLFGYDFMTKEWPKLEVMKKEWKNGSLETIQVLQKLVSKVSNGKVRPSWLRKSMENPGLSPLK